MASKYYSRHLADGFLDEIYGKITRRWKWHEYGLCQCEVPEASLELFLKRSPAPICPVFLQRSPDLQISANCPNSPHHDPYVFRKPETHVSFYEGDRYTETNYDLPTSAEFTVEIGWKKIIEYVEKKWKIPEDLLFMVLPGPSCEFPGLLRQKYLSIWTNKIEQTHIIFNIDVSTRNLGQNIEISYATPGGCRNYGLEQIVEAEELLQELAE
ncbi:unnamed protein product, partial [Mesorhabditis spiculigera]